MCSLLDRVHQMGRLGDVCVRVPVQSKLRLGLTALLTAVFSGWLLAFLALLLLLLVVAVELVAVLENPLALAAGLVVGEAAFIEGTVGVDPLAVGDLALLPLSIDLHAGRLVQIGASALLLAEFPPA